MDRQLGMQVRAVAQQQVAGRILRQHRDVGVHVHVGVAQLAGPAIQRVVTRKFRAIVRRAAPLEIDNQRLPITADRWQVGDAGGAVAAVAAAGDAEFRRRRARRMVNDMNDA